MWNWLDKNTNALQGLGAMVTALAALAALIIIPLQINAAEQIQQRQTAREMYRGFVQITLERPALASADYCALKTGDEVTAYGAYMEYMLYTGEQLMLAAAADWSGTLLDLFGGHRSYFCAQDDWAGYDPAIQALIAQVRLDCPAAPGCTAFG